MAIVLLAAGAICAAVLIFNSFVTGLQGRERRAPADSTLAALAVLATLAALAANALTAEPDARVEQGALLLGGALLVISLIAAALQWVRQHPLRASGAALGVLTGLLVLLAAIGVPFLQAYLSLGPVEPPTPTSAVTALATGLTPNTPVTAAPTAEPMSAEAQRAEMLFFAVRDVVMDEVGLDEATIIAALEAGTPLVRLVEDNGGDIDRVIMAITTIMNQAIRDARASGQMNAIEAALMLSQMGVFVRLAAHTDLNLLGDQIVRPTRTPTPIGGAPETTAEATAPAADAAARSTPRPSAAPEMSCLAQIERGAPLRAAPDAEADVVGTIRFATTIILYERTADLTGWRTNWNDQAAWIDAEALTLGAGCQDLPVSEAD